MGLVIFAKYLDIGKALVTFSALEAGGFHPSYHNYHHAHIAYMQMIAFGGLIIQIPEQEFEGAKAWIIHLQESPELEGDDLPERKFGMWRNTLAIVSFHSPLFIFSPLLLLRVKLAATILATLFLAVIAGLIAGIMAGDIFVIEFFSLFLAAFVSAILLGLAAVWPLKTLIGCTLFWLATVWFLGFSHESMAFLVTLFPLLILIHAKHIALPRLQRKRTHVS